MWSDEHLKVAPYAGAWIEIFGAGQRHRGGKSLPTRERGLKSLGGAGVVHIHPVAPYAGAWIEIPTCPSIWGGVPRRSLRGSVD